MRRTLLPLLLALTLAARALATAEVTELGDGLAYMRVRSLATAAETLDAVLPQGRALVLDLRAGQASVEDPAVLGALLARRRGPGPLYILVGPQTPAAFRVPLSRLPSGALTLGIAGSVPAPAVVIDQAPDADRRAYEALDADTPLEQLVSGKIEKERFDEASLVKEFENGNPYAEPPPSPDPAGTKPAEPKDAIPTDRVLQRALHLHRALAALKAR